MGKLIITADDYGLNPSVNQAILESVKNRTVTSVHVLTNYASDKDIEDLATAIHNAGNHCGIGLHFCTTAGESLIQEANSINYKSHAGAPYRFYDISEWNYQGSNSHDLFMEMSKQFEKLRRIIGAERIDSFSSHHNIHLFSEAYMRILVELAEDSWIPIRSPLRWTQDKGLKNFRDGLGLSPIEKTSINMLIHCKAESTQKLLLSALDKDLMLSNRGMANDNKKTGGTPNSTSSHWYGQPSKRALEWTVNQLTSIRPKKPFYATEIYAHLAVSTEYEDPSLNYPMRERVMEYATLNSPEVRQFIQSLYDNPEIEFGSYRKVLLGEKISYQM
jgi:predicted glycoside hydrolase/deacetylase ChbG (UPF0249 family)